MIRDWKKLIYNYEKLLMCVDIVVKENGFHGKIPAIRL